ncbi:DinB family protein [Sphingobacterium deserti]|uniref:DinB-like domain-containing protein n=1 Tax=Sphingobacterium deserti TaxID=1229276 RepID=A0A0B8SZU1_9SPHI|nr:DinB family protein [Sphingobacterium deserti]KGE13527.1 hypothetical protein DI53_2715 [Sphingobacterium deserti]
MMEYKTAEAFEEVSDAFVDIIKNLDEEVLNTKPADGGWSPGQIGDHIRKSYASVDTMNGNSRETEREPDARIPEIKSTFLNFDIKMESPEGVLPTEKRIDKEKLLGALELRIRQSIDVIDNHDLTHTCTDYEIPEYGAFTRLEWLWFNIYHTQRHLKQLQDTVKALRKAD